LEIDAFTWKETADGPAAWYWCLSPAGDDTAPHLDVTLRFRRQALNRILKAVDRLLSPNGVRGKLHARRSIRAGAGHRVPVRD
jgi:hypothetical protein